MLKKGCQHGWIVSHKKWNNLYHVYKVCVWKIFPSAPNQYLTPRRRVKVLNIQFRKLMQSLRVESFFFQQGSDFEIHPQLLLGLAFEMVIQSSSWWPLPAPSIFEVPREEFGIQLCNTIAIQGNRTFFCLLFPKGDAEAKARQKDVKKQNKIAVWWVPAFGGYSFWSLCVQTSLVG